MAIIQTEIKAIRMVHPKKGVLVYAKQVGYFIDPATGRNAGLRLEFPDGQVASLTYDEIRQLQSDADNFCE